MTDPALFHATLWHFASHKIRLTLRPSKEDTVDLLTHQIKAIQLVNARLGDPLHRLSDSTIATVACIASVEVCKISAPPSFDTDSTPKDMLLLPPSLNCTRQRPSRNDRNPRWHLKSRLRRPNTSTSFLGRPKLRLSTRCVRILPPIPQPQPSPPRTLRTHYQPTSPPGLPTQLNDA